MGVCVVHAAYSLDVIYTSDSAQTVIMLADASEGDDPQQALERSLQEFDEKLLRELEETQQAREENARQKAVLRSDAELDAEDQGEGEEGSEGQSQQEGEGQAASAEGSDSGEESNETATTSGQESTGQSGGAPGATTETAETEQSNPASQEQEGSSNTQVSDIPSGNDDDVIARQLREAAEAETDPEVKEKLWEEYRKYKNQQNSAP